MPTGQEFKAPCTRSFAAAVVGYFSFAMCWGALSPWLAPPPGDPPHRLTDFAEGFAGGIVLAIFGLVLVVGVIILALAMIWARVQLSALKRVGGAWWAPSMVVGMAAGLVFGWMFWTAFFSGFRSHPLPDLVAGVVAGGLAGLVLVWSPPAWRPKRLSRSDLFT